MSSDSPAHRPVFGSVADVTARLADAGDRELRFQAVREAMARTSDADMRSYEEETREWLDADLGA